MDYLCQARYKNTICGRHPIAVLLNSLKALRASGGGGRDKEGHDLRFVKYAQSSACRRESDSSVSYASAVLKCSCA